MKGHREVYVLVLNRPPDVTVGRMKHYIKTAVECWNGQFDPTEDPLFGWFNERGNRVHVSRRGLGEKKC